MTGTDLTVLAWAPAIITAIVGAVAVLVVWEREADAAYRLRRRNRINARKLAQLRRTR